MKKTLLALILAASALFAINVSADEAQPEETAAAPEEISAPIEIEGTTLIHVTSSDSSVPGTYEKINTSLLFDRLAATGCYVEFIEVAEGEEPEEGIPTASAKTVSIYTSTGVPNALEAISLLIESEKGTTIAVNLYGTNDNLLLDWTQLSFANMYGENGDYNVFKVAGENEKFVFYRIDLTLVEGNSFTINEIGLYKNSNDTAEYKYVFEETLEAGETPELVEVAEEAEVPEEPAEETDDLNDVPSFGLGGSLPGMLRPVPHK